MSLQLTERSIELTISVAAIKTIDKEIEITIDFNALRNVNGIEILNFSQQLEGSIIPTHPFTTAEISQASFDLEVDCAYFKFHTNKMDTLLNALNTLDSVTITGHVIVNEDTQSMKIIAKW